MSSRLFVTAFTAVGMFCTGASNAADVQALVQSCAACHGENGQPADPKTTLVVWGQGGMHPRGAMYRPDFDVLPPEVVPNLARLVDQLRDDKVAFGVTARPGQMATPLDWTTAS